MKKAKAQGILTTRRLCQLRPPSTLSNTLSQIYRFGHATSSNIPYRADSVYNLNFNADLGFLRKDVVLFSAPSTLSNTRGLLR